MPKKKVKKASSAKKKAVKKTAKKTSAANAPKVGSKLEKTLIENLVQLQKVQTDMAVKFDKLSKQISNLLSLFESAARSFSEHPAIKAGEKDKEFLEKINQLMQQNRELAKGLSVMGETVKERVYGENHEGERRRLPEVPRVPMAPSRMARPGEGEEFKPSISGKPLKRL